MNDRQRKAAMQDGGSSVLKRALREREQEARTAATADDRAMAEVGAGEIRAELQRRYG